MKTRKKDNRLQTLVILIATVLLTGLSTQALGSTPLPEETSEDVEGHLYFPPRRSPCDQVRVLREDPASGDLRMPVASVQRFTSLAPQRLTPQSSA